jgi:hypothetical protein
MSGRRISSNLTFNQNRFEAEKIADGDFFNVLTQFTCVVASVLVVR